MCGHRFGRPMNCHCTNLQPPHVTGGEVSEQPRISVCRLTDVGDGVQGRLALKTVSQGCLNDRSFMCMQRQCAIFVKQCQMRGFRDLCGVIIGCEGDVGYVVWRFLEVCYNTGSLLGGLLPQLCYVCRRMHQRKILLRRWPKCSELDDLHTVYWVTNTFLSDIFLLWTTGLHFSLLRQPFFCIQVNPVTWGYICRPSHLKTFVLLCVPRHHGHWQEAYD